MRRSVANTEVSCCSVSIYTPSCGEVAALFSACRKLSRSSEAISFTRASSLALRPETTRLSS